MISRNDPEGQPESTLDAALSYAALHFPVHPLHYPIFSTRKDYAQIIRCSCGNRTVAHQRAIGKHPMLDGWPDLATTDEATIRQWWTEHPLANIGLILGDRYGALDIDVRNAGDLTLEAYEARYGKLPPTVVVQTGGGGWHDIFSLPSVLPTIKLGPGIDFITGTRHYLVAPPSMHKSGQRYCFEASSSFEDVKIHTLPQWLVDLIGERTTTYTAAALTLPNTLPTVHVDLLKIPDRIRRVILHGQDTAHPFQSRSEAVWAVINTMLREGCADAVITAVLLDSRFGISERQLERNDPLIAGWVATEIARARTKAETIPPINARSPEPGWDEDTSDPNAAAGEGEHRKVDWKAGLQLTNTGAPVENISNIGRILQYHPFWQQDKNRLWLDATRFRYMRGDQVIDDPGIVDIARWFGDRTRMSTRSRANIGACVQAESRKRPRDVLKESIEALPPWDGQERLKDWLQVVAGAPKTTNSYAVSRIIPVVMVARALNPGCQQRFMIVFIGPENVGKSKLVRALVSPEWYIDAGHINLANKESKMLIRGKWGVELSELDSYYASEETTIKSFITTEVDEIIPKYSNDTVQHPRRAILFGTTNDSAFLKGQTGNTRFLLVETPNIDIEKFYEMREQLLAEAVDVYRKSLTSWWTFTPEELKALNTEREKRQDVPIIADALRQWLDVERFMHTRPTFTEQADTSEPELNITTSLEVARGFLQVDASRWTDRNIARSIGKALRYLGYRDTTRRVSGKVERIWRKEESTIGGTADAEDEDEEV